MFGGVALKLIALLSGGGLQGAMSAVGKIYTAKLAAGNDHEKMAADLAARQLMLDAQEASIQAGLTNTERWYGPRALMGYSVAFYIAKILVWDKCLHLGVTDAPDDKLWWIITTIVIAYFGARTVRDVVAAFRARN